jgi:Glycosyltransferase family 87
VSASTRPAARNLPLTALVGLLVGFHVFVFVAYYQWRLSTPTSVLGSDLRAFYTSWRIVLEGHASRMYDIDEQLRAQSVVMGRPMNTDGLLAFVNPPYVSFAFAWLGLLRVRVAYAVFSATQLLALGSACVLLLRHEMGGWSKRAQVLFLGSGVLSASTLSAITLGTFTPTILLAVVAIIVESRAAVTGARTVSHRKIGAWLCVLTIKPQLAVFVVVALVAARQWKALRSAAGIGALIVAASSAVSGPRIWLRYLDLLRTYGASNGKFGGDSHYMWNLRGLLSRIDGLPLRTADRISTALFLVGLVAFGVWVHRVWWQPSRVTFERVVVLTLSLTVLLTPHCNRQDTLLLLPAVVALINVRIASVAPRRVDAFAVGSCLLSAVALMWDNDPRGYPMHPVTLLALVTAALVWRIQPPNTPGTVEGAGNLVVL